jgi:hypothetical protein
MTFMFIVQRGRTPYDSQGLRRPPRLLRSRRRHGLPQRLVISPGKKPELHFKSADGDYRVRFKVK